jgi:negative regulator of flagellin synthesis FlgM
MTHNAMMEVPMDISQKLPPTQHPSSVKPVQTVRKPPAANKIKPRTAPTGDRVEISAKAREIQTAKDMIRKLPDMDEEKVAEIKARIKAGTYKVNSRAAASKMIAESLLKEMG